jgi:hypothetical protein
MKLNTNLEFNFEFDIFLKTKFLHNNENRILQMAPVFYRNLFFFKIF